MVSVQWTVASEKQNPACLSLAVVTDRCFQDFHRQSTSVTYHPLPQRFLPSYADNELADGSMPLRGYSLGMDSVHLYSLVVAGGSAAALGVYTLLRREPKGPAELERERRTWLDGIGPVSDGHHAAVLLIYKYDVAGVSYECSQDVTYLRQWINLHSCRLGLPTSVKYDPHNPGNSLVVSESWMGLRQ
jgi:hypothetical protein